MRSRNVFLAAPTDFLPSFFTPQYETDVYRCNNERVGFLFTRQCAGKRSVNLEDSSFKLLHRVLFAPTKGVTCIKRHPIYLTKIKVLCLVCLLRLYLRSLVSNTASQMSESGIVTLFIAVYNGGSVIKTSK